MTKYAHLTPQQSKSLKTKEDHYLELVAIATENGGKCLDSVYVASNVKMNFKCIDNHEWSARPNDIKRGTWCPFCRSNKTENLVRQFFEIVFDKPFKGASPDWLQVEGERKCILDGLNTELNIAFEYHGEQHYHYIPHFHDRNHKTFEAQQFRDEKVRTLCKENNVHLVEIKYLTDGYSKKDFIVYMTSIFETALGMTISAEKITAFEDVPFSSSKLIELQDIAKKMKGECLANKYMGINSKVEWKCEKGHIWSAIPKSIKKGHWCPYCNGRLREGDVLAEISAIAEQKGGKCLSTIFKTTNDPLSFVCAKGHTFEKKGQGILYADQWCPYCSRHKLIEPFKEIKEYAISKGGECLSVEYINASKPLIFKCKDNHTWSVGYSNMMHRKSWCPTCSHKNRAKNLGSFLKIKQPTSKLKEMKV